VREHAPGGGGAVSPGTAGLCPPSTRRGSGRCLRADDLGDVTCEPTAAGQWSGASAAEGRGGARARERVGWVGTPPPDPNGRGPAAQAPTNVLVPRVEAPLLDQRSDTFRTDLRVLLAKYLAPGPS